MNITLMVITDGRWDYLRQTIESADKMLDCEFTRRIIVDDSGEQRELDFPGYRIVRSGVRRGLAGAIQMGWSFIGGCDYVFHLEDDFIFPAPVPVMDMIGVLEQHDDLAQMALLRQPWSPQEHEAGGIVAMNPDDYIDHDGWIEHSRLFTFNPCVYPRRIATLAGTESQVTERLLAHGYRFGYYGARTDAPRCCHIGYRRSRGYKL